MTFTNASKDATSYYWDFADGQSSSEQNPKHTYTVAGSYTVKLTAKGAGGSNQVTQIITIQAPPAAAVAQFSVAGEGCTAPCAVTLTNQSQNATSYQWDFGDGQTSTEHNPQHTYTQGKIYAIKLIATGPRGSSMLSKDVSIQIPPPVADFTFTGGECTIPCEVAFTNKSTNADTYQWDFGDGGSSTEASPRHQYTKGGTFQVVLTATGNGKTATKTQPVTTKVYVVTKFWDKTFGGSNFDALYSIVATPEGGFLLSGYSNSSVSGDKTADSRGGNDYWLIKINANGVKQWDKTFGGSSNDYFPSGIVATSDGGFLVGGTSDSPASGDKTADSKGGNDYWLIKINVNGVKQWDKTFGGSGNDNLSSIVATADGGFLVGGYSQSPASGDKTEDGKGAGDYWLIKINVNGVKQWDKTFGGSSDDNLHSIVATADGGFLVGGESQSSASGDKTENRRGNNSLTTDYWLIKINGSGVKQWDKTFGGSGNDNLSSIVATSDGGFWVGGSSDSPASGDKMEEGKGFNDCWLIKINGSGVKQWDKTFGGPGFDYLRSMVATADGGGLVGGDSGSSASGDKTENSKGFGDYWLIKINGSGVKQWDKTFGGAESDYLRSIIATADGGFLVGGESDSPASGDKTENSHERFWDYWLIKIK
ncbi:hypothetical protein GCM10027423_43600 [Spirosoma arcticum]